MLNIDKEQRKKYDKLRSSILYKDEPIYVRYIGKRAGFTNGEIMPAYPSSCHRSDLPYPYPKWIACRYRVQDADGDWITVLRYEDEKIHKNFELVSREEYENGQ